MLEFLGDILHAILDLPYLIVGLLIEAVNGWILILAAVLSVVLSLLPGFPSFPELPDGIAGGLNWFIPVVALAGVFAGMVVCWVTFLAVKVALNWAKAL